MKKFVIGILFICILILFNCSSLPVYASSVDGTTRTYPINSRVEYDLTVTDDYYYQRFLETGGISINVEAGKTYEIKLNLNTCYAICDANDSIFNSQHLVVGFHGALNRAFSMENLYYGATPVERVYQFTSPLTGVIHFFMDYHGYKLYNYVSGTTYVQPNTVGVATGSVTVKEIIPEVHTPPTGYELVASGSVQEDIARDYTLGDTFPTTLLYDAGNLTGNLVDGAKYCLVFDGISIDYGVTYAAIVDTVNSSALFYVYLGGQYVSYTPTLNQFFTRSFYFDLSTVTGNSDPFSLKLYDALSYTRLNNFSSYYQRKQLLFDWYLYKEVPSGSGTDTGGSGTDTGGSGTGTVDTGSGGTSTSGQSVKTFKADAFMDYFNQDTGYYLGNYATYTIQPGSSLTSSYTEHIYLDVSDILVADRRYRIDVLELEDVSFCDVVVSDAGSVTGTSAVTYRNNYEVQLNGKTVANDGMTSFEFIASSQTRDTLSIKCTYNAQANVSSNFNGVLNCVEGCRYEIVVTDITDNTTTALLTNIDDNVAEIRNHQENIDQNVAKISEHQQNIDRNITDINNREERIDSEVTEISETMSSDATQAITKYQEAERAILDEAMPNLDAVDFEAARFENLPAGVLASMSWTGNILQRLFDLTEYKSIYVVVTTLALAAIIIGLRRLWTGGGED